VNFYSFSFIGYSIVCKLDLLSSINLVSDCPDGSGTIFYSSVLVVVGSVSFLTNNEFIYFGFSKDRKEPRSPPTAVFVGGFCKG